MSHVNEDKQKLLNRLRRLRGQLDGAERAIQEERDCSAILMNLAAVRGALHGLMTEVLEHHLHHHLTDENRNVDTEQLIELVRLYAR